MGSEGQTQKSYFDVLGICCTSEVPLIERILMPLEGIQKVSVIVPSKTVIVVHDTQQISQLQIVKALNQARLEASISSYGADKMVNRWPSPYILFCGVLLLVSLFQNLYRPLKWAGLVAVVVCLPQIILRSVTAIRKFTLDINILMLIAVGGAVALEDYSEAGFIVFLFTIAEWLESMASRKATTGMSLLMSRAPQKANLAQTGEMVDAKDIEVNTMLAVKAGEVIPIDGIVVDGRCEVDEKSLSGESFPVPKQPQSLVWAGTLNIDGYITVKTTALSENSAVAKMARLVEEAQSSRSRTHKMIDSCAKYYTPAVVVIAAGVALVPLVLKAQNMRHWLKLALVFLVSACPCALVLSTPVATFCSFLTAAKIGLLIKGGDILEALGKTKLVAFDKTGTITTGEFSVMEMKPLSSEVDKHTLLLWISSLESKSSHPMASALVEYARLNSIEPKPDSVSDFHIYPGEGVSGEINGEKIFIGNKRIAVRAGCMRAPDNGNMKEAVTLGYVFLGTVPVGIFALSDTCRSGAKEGIEELKSLGIRTAMLTGDSTAAALHVQKQLDNVIEEIHAELLPEGKVQIISNLKAKRGATVMVGDGMNDAPALAAATVGISMGISGSAIAMETSHITLMSNDIRRIPAGIRLAKRAQRTIIENIVFSAIVKAAILGLAIGGHPLLWAAVLADVGTCLLVIINSMKLLRAEKKEAKKCCPRSIFQKSCHVNGFCKIGAEEEEKSSGICCGEDCGHEHLISMPCKENSHEHAGHEHEKHHSCEENSHKQCNHACHEHNKHRSHEVEHSGRQPDHCHHHKTESAHAHSIEETVRNHAINICDAQFDQAAGDGCSTIMASENEESRGRSPTHAKECLKICCRSGTMQPPEIIVE